MSKSSEFERLRILFSRCSAPPCVRQTVQRLLAATEDEHCSISKLEEIVVTDPALTARLLSAAKGHTFDAHDHAYTTVRGTILRLGFRAVRALGLTLSLHGVVAKGQGGGVFDPLLVARHSLMVGFLASALHETATLRTDPKSWNSDEVLAAGVLHELAYLVLWSVDPELYDTLRYEAQARRLSVEQAFFDAVGGHLQDLGSLACESWGVPPAHARASRSLHDPAPGDPDYRIHCALHYADRLACITGLTKSTLQYVQEPIPEVVDALGVDEATALQVAGDAKEMVDAVYPPPVRIKRSTAA